MFLLLFQHFEKRQCHYRNDGYSSRLVKRCRKFIEPYRVTDGRGFKLSRYDPGDLGKLGKDSKKEAVDKLEKGIELLEQLQEVLYASESHALLVVLQAMDSAGKDGIVKHVMGGVNPQGCVVSSFKQPSTLERSHDFLWRCVARLPRRGMIGIFNRSYYEEVLSVRVHPEFLAGEGFNPSHAKSAFWEERFRSINNLERHLLANRTSIVKYSSTFPQRNRENAFWHGWILRTKIGSFLKGIFMNANSGTSTRKRMRR